MVRTEQLSQYSSLLKIRQKARRRDAIISGSVLLIAVLATIALGLLGDFVSTRNPQVLAEFAPGDQVLLVGSEAGQVAAGRQENGN